MHLAQRCGGGACRFTDVSSGFFIALCTSKDSRRLNRAVYFLRSSTVYMRFMLYGPIVRYIGNFLNSLPCLRRIRYFCMVLLDLAALVCTLSYLVWFENDSEAVNY